MPETRWKLRWKIFFGCLLMLIGGLLFTEHERRVKIATQEADFEQRLMRARSEFPVGMTRVAVNEQLRKEYPYVEDSNLSRTYVDMGKEDSDVWYCNFWKEQLEFSFADGTDDAKLTGIKRRAIGQCL